MNVYSVNDVKIRENQHPVVLVYGLQQVWHFDRNTMIDPIDGFLN